MPEPFLTDPHKSRGLPPPPRQPTKIISEIKATINQVDEEIAKLEKKLEPIIGDRSYTLLATIVNFQSDKDSPLTRDLLTLQDRVNKLKAVIANITDSIQL